MSGWMIAALVLFLLFLVGQIPVGISARYGPDGPLVHARAGPLKTVVFPRPKRKKKKKAVKQPPKQEKKKTVRPKTGPEKPKQPPKPAPEKKKPQKPLELIQEWFPLIRELLPLALEAAGCFWNKLVLDRLELCLTVGAEDPADAAILYGQACAALGALWQPLTQAFHIKDGRAHVQLDFQAARPSLTGQAALSLKIGQILWLGLCFGSRVLVRFLRFYIQKRRNRPKEERKAV
ncbi:MAG: DUF2953 domain-containing protein [Lawsonibacter sp.]|nr:DUF2953 domain-containing protein [Lawsonibacter sp.]